MFIDNNSSLSSREATLNGVSASGSKCLFGKVIKTVLQQGNKDIVGKRNHAIHINNLIFPDILSLL